MAVAGGDVAYDNVFCVDCNHGDSNRYSCHIWRQQLSQHLQAGKKSLKYAKKGIIEYLFTLKASYRTPWRGFFSGRLLIQR